MSIKEQKNQIRAILRERRDTISTQERALKSQSICNHVTKFIGRNDIVMVYTAKEKEVDTTYLIKSLFSTKNLVVVPIIQKHDVSLRLSYLFDLSVLTPSTFGVLEPINHEIPANAPDVDIVILPMLGFDNQCRRIGYGAGYYDRFLTRNKHIQKIGIAFDCQEMDDLPQGNNDVYMDHIITESKTYHR